MPWPAFPTKTSEGQEGGALRSAPGPAPDNSPSPGRAEQDELPEGWQRRPLGDICELVSEQVQPGKSEGLRYIGLEHIDSGEPTLKRWGSTDEVRSAKSCFDAGDVLYGKLRPYLDKAANAEFRGICSTDILVFRAKSSRAVPEFLVSALHTTAFLRHAVSTTTGVNHPRTSWSALKSYSLCVPPLLEQQAIAEVLQTVQRAKEATEKVIAATRQLKASLMKHLFTYGPVPMEQAAHVPLNEMEGGAFPAAWEMKRFDSFATLQRGQDLPRWEFKGGPIPVIGATTIIGYHDTANVKGPGVTVVRSGSSVGKPLFIDRDFWAHNVVLYVKDFHGNDPKFVFYKLLVLGLEKFRAGVAVPTLNRNTFSNAQITVPALWEQQQIAMQLSAVDAELAAEESRRAALAALFQSLLHHLMTGKLRLPEFAEGKA